MICFVQLVIAADMLMQEIQINQIQIEKSIFSTKEVLFVSEMDDSSLNESFHKLGIITPVVLYKDAYNVLHLVEGKKRLAYAVKSNHEYIQALILPDTARLADIVLLIYNEKKEIINQSVLNKIQFLLFCLRLGVQDSELNLLSTLGFKFYSNFYEDCLRISSLPLELRKFCHEKNLSFKHLVNLSFYPYDILFNLIRWKSLLPFTASTFEEIASNLRDYLKANDKTIDDFLSDKEVQKILTSDMKLPRQKLEQLRGLIFAKKFPMLCSANEKIKDVVSKLNLPKEINISWDKTLENKGVEVRFSINKIEVWKNILDSFNLKTFESALTAILDEL